MDIGGNQNPWTQKSSCLIDVNSINNVYMFQSFFFLVTFISLDIYSFTILRTTLTHSNSGQ